MNELDFLLQSIKNLTNINEEELTDDVLNTIIASMDEQFSPQVIAQSVNQIVKNLEDQGLTKIEAAEAVQGLSDTLRELVYAEEEYTGNRKILVEIILNRLLEVFHTALEKYHSYAIELPMTVDTTKGAQVPTYAHDTDAAADMYAVEDVELPPHFYGTPVGTGVHIQLPEGWVAMLFPRSSMGAKTTLRLSNSVGIIDSGYRGEIRALYDNIGDEPYQIHKGDRIAQLMVMPSYRFKAKVVDILADSDRGEGGFGSTGK